MTTQSAAIQVMSSPTFLHNPAPHSPNPTCLPAPCPCRLSPQPATRPQSSHARRPRPIPSPTYLPDPCRPFASHPPTTTRPAPAPRAPAQPDPTSLASPVHCQSPSPLCRQPLPPPPSAPSPSRPCPTRQPTPFLPTSSRLRMSTLLNPSLSDSPSQLRPPRTRPLPARLLIATQVRPILLDFPLHPSVSPRQAFPTSRPQSVLSAPRSTAQPLPSRPRTTPYLPAPTCHLSSRLTLPARPRPLRLPSPSPCLPNPHPTSLPSPPPAHLVPGLHDLPCPLSSAHLTPTRLPPPLRLGPAQPDPQRRPWPARLQPCPAPALPCSTTRACPNPPPSRCLVRPIPTRRPITRQSSPHDCPAHPIPVPVSPRLLRLSSPLHPRARHHSSLPTAHACPRLLVADLSRPDFPPHRSPVRVNPCRHPRPTRVRPAPTPPCPLRLAIPVRLVTAPRSTEHPAPDISAQPHPPHTNPPLIDKSPQSISRRPDPALRDYPRQYLPGPIPLSPTCLHSASRTYTARLPIPPHRASAPCRPSPTCPHAPHHLMACHPSPTCLATPPTAQPGASRQPNSRPDMPCRLRANPPTPIRRPLPHHLPPPPHPPSSASPDNSIPCSSPRPTSTTQPKVTETQKRKGNLNDRVR
jgi:hypothetical protein